MKKQMHNPTMMIKSKFSNQVHRILEPNIDVKQSLRWKHRDKYKFTDAQKIQMFDQILQLHAESSEELSSYRADRSKKKRVAKEREARGWVSKKKQKMTKDMWEKQQAFAAKS